MFYLQHIRPKEIEVQEMEHGLSVTLPFPEYENDITIFYGKNKIEYYEPVPPSVTPFPDGSAIYKTNRLTIGRYR